MLEESSTRWQDLYTAAIFERDPNHAPERIAQAERAITERVHALFCLSGSNRSELSALNAALYALQILKDCSPPKNAA